MHVSTASVMPYMKEPLSWNWWLAQAVYSTRWCIPAFVLLSGALLLDPSREEPARLFYHKRMARIMIPLVTWTIVYAGYAILRMYLGAGLSLAAMKVPIFQGTAYFHLWYLWMIIGLYAFTPFFRIFLKHATPRQCGGLVFWLFLFSEAYWIMAAVVGRRYYCVINDLLVFPPFLFYFFAGHFLAHTGLVRVRPQWWALGVLAFWMAGVGGELLVYRLYGKPLELFYSHFSPTVAGMAICFFMAAWTCDSRLRQWSPRVKLHVKHAAEATLGVYCIHVLVIQGWYGLSISSFAAGTAIKVLVGSAAVFLISMGIAQIMVRVPVLKRTVR